MHKQCEATEVTVEASIEEKLSSKDDWKVGWNLARLGGTNYTAN